MFTIAIFPKQPLFNAPRHLRRNFKHTWTKPDGFDTGIKIYNCAARDKIPLIVKNKDLVTWYTCGPTVYDHSHVGHASCYVKLDIIQRILRQHVKLNLVTVMNITDVDDKIIQRSRALKIPSSELTSKFEKEFWRDLDNLGVKRPDLVLGVTDNMDLIKRFIQRLLEQDQAYVGKDNSIYFDVEKSKQLYGKLVNCNWDKDNNTSEVKKSPMDFAIWKSVDNPEAGFSWDSPWGWGRPGWHIECSALASHIFGQNLDFHAGGIDLKFPHHENEEAQCCAYHSTDQWVNYWVHTGHLSIAGGEKMSKSLKNTISIEAMLQETSAEVFRLACAMSHYSSPMEFSNEFMRTAENVLRNFRNFQERCRLYSEGLIKSSINGVEVTKLVGDSCARINEALVDDFNTPIVVNVLNDLVHGINYLMQSGTSQDLALGDCDKSSVLGARNLLLSTLDLLGLGSSNVRSSDSNFVEVMDILNSFRQDVRLLAVARNDQALFQLCDLVRDDLKKSGVVVKDLGNKSSWTS